MTAINYYLLTDDGRLDREETRTEMDPIPTRFTLTAPPAPVDGYHWVWSSVEWVSVPDSVFVAVPAPILPAPGPAIPRIAMIGLLQDHGGMTDALYTASKADTNVAPLWALVSQQSTFLRGEKLTTDFLAALVAGSYLPAGSAAVIAAWV